jgi:hypothetical protein
VSWDLPLDFLLALGGVLVSLYFLTDAVLREATLAELGWTVALGINVYIL